MIISTIFHIHVCESSVSCYYSRCHSPHSQSNSCVLFTYFPVYARFVQCRNGLFPSIRPHRTSNADGQCASFRKHSNIQPMMLCLVVPRPPSRPLCAKSCHIFYVCFALSTTISGWHHENLHSLSISSSLQSMARLGLIYSKCAEIIDFYSLISSVNIH